MYSWVITTFCFSIIFRNGDTECTFRLDTSEGGNNPMVFYNSKILNPNDKEGTVHLQDYEIIQLFCPGDNNFLKTSEIGAFLNATCVDNHFTLDTDPGKRRYAYKSLSCKKPPQSRALRTVDQCNLGSKLIRIGFKFQSTSFNFFHSTIEVCFDDTNLVTYWTKNELETSGYSCQVEQTTTFKEDFFNNAGAGGPNYIYNITKGFDKGHLTPKCDFFTGAEKKSTFYHINAAPQVVKFNRGNWRQLEAIIRKMASSRREPFYIYTGTTTTVNYMLINKRKMPISLYFWKVVIEKSSGKGVAFIGINDVTKDVGNPCPTDVCDQLTWLGKTFNRTVVAKGKVYCCTIDSLQNIPNIQIPDFSEYTGFLLT